MPITRFEPGDVVVEQEIWGDRVWAARPLRVVRDDDDLTVVWFPRGTRWKAPVTPPGRTREPSRGERHATSLLLGDWTFADAEWDVDTLRLVRPGEWHATWISWLPSGEHWGWYVNLQRPLERTEIGFRTMDLVLDVIVDPDLTWRYKDEDELAIFVDRGVFDRDTVARVRAEALQVIERAERRDPPFSEQWPDWKPEADWPLPELAEGWDRPSPSESPCR